MLNGDLVEGTNLDKAKEFSDLHKPHTAVTLRVTKPYHHRHKIIIGDAYFGSLATAVALAKVGTWCCMNVKLASKGFPKAVLKERVTTRGDTAHMTVKIPDMPKHSPIQHAYASAHCDIKPMILVHTCYTANPGNERVRTWRGMVEGQFVRKTYRL